MDKIITVDIELNMSDYSKSRLTVDFTRYKNKLDKIHMQEVGAAWKSKFKSGDEYLSCTIELDKKRKLYISDNQNKVEKNYPDYTIRTKETKEQEAEIIGNMYDYGYYRFGWLEIENVSFKIALLEIKRQKTTQPNYIIFMNRDEKLDTKIDGRQEKKARPLKQGIEEE